MKQNKFKISNSLRYSLTNVLDRRGISYDIQYIDDTLYCSLNMSGSMFHKIVIRAKMEQLQREEASSIPYVSEVELQDPVVMLEVGSVYIIK